MAAALARSRYRTDPCQRPLAGRRLDFESGAPAAARTPRRRAGAPGDLAVVSGAAGARRYRQQVLSQISARADPRDSLSALHDDRYRRRRAAPAGADRAVLRLAVPCQPGQAHPLGDAAAVRRTATADPARWRPHLAQSRRAGRTAQRHAAAAPDLCRAQHRATAGAAERDRSHDADDAAVQRHEQRAVRPGGDAARL